MGFSQPDGWARVALIAGEGRALGPHCIKIADGVLGSIYVMCSCGIMAPTRITTAREALTLHHDHQQESTPTNDA